MATEAARLKRKKKPQGGKTKADLTHTGLLMEGLILSCRVPTQLETQHYWGPLWAPNLFQGRSFRLPKPTQLIRAATNPALEPTASIVGSYFAPLRILKGWEVP